MQNPHRDGLHFTKAVNIFVYKKLLGIFADSYSISPGKLPRHRPKHLDAFYGPGYADEDGRIKKYVPKKK